MGTWSENQRARIAREAWLADLDRRMALADGSFTPEERLDAMAALMAYSNDRLPEGHPQKVTEEDVEYLLRGEVSASRVRLAAKLRRLFPPDPGEPPV